MAHKLFSAGLIADLIDFIFPALCAGCGSYCENRSGLCELCNKQIQTFSKPFCLACLTQADIEKKCPHCKEVMTPLFAYGDYSGPLKEIIRQLKFHGVTTPVNSIAGRLHAQFADLIEPLTADTLVPIPLYSGREYHRGYNQAELFAQAINGQCSMSVNTDLLFRNVKKKEQAKLRFEDRIENIKNVFEYAEPADDNQSGLRIILVDDVITSGETVKEAKKILEQNGHFVVGVMAMAHGV